MALSLLIKPASGSCNMRCQYCFYCDETENRAQASMGIMTFETMDHILSEVYKTNCTLCSITFQGGEPTLLGLDFYRHFTHSVHLLPNPHNVRIQISFQTNGLLIDDDWATWFAENNVLVGISLDGPESIHDLYRVDSKGSGTFQRVMNSIHILKKHSVDFNILTVITANTANNAENIYRFFRENHLYYQQYIECLDPIGFESGKQDYSLNPIDYATFLHKIFDLWYQDMMSDTYVYNRYFENLLMIIAHQGSESCSLKGFCGTSFVIEADGSVYPCDFYVLDNWNLGNILTSSWDELEKLRKDSEFIQQSFPIPAKCKQCDVFALCRNGCRRCRTNNIDSIPENYFCEAYKSFLTYAIPKLQDVLSFLQQKV